MRVTVLVHESESLGKGDKFVTGTINDGNLSREDFAELLNGMLGKFSGIISSQVPEKAPETVAPPATLKVAPKRTKRNVSKRSEG